MNGLMPFPYHHGCRQRHDDVNDDEPEEDEGMSRVCMTKAEPTESPLTSVNPRLVLLLLLYQGWMHLRFRLRMHFLWIAEHGVV